MTTHMKEVQELMFGAGGLRVANVKLFPGSNRFATPEQIAAEIKKGLAEIEAGEAAEMVAG